MAAPAKRNQLPQKEAQLFKQIVKHYENKEYKKALKCAEQILKKFPTHGETLAMKGLTLSRMGKKDEAFALVKEGVRHDVSSFVCWHAYGLLYQFERNYQEAIKCYRNALRIDKQNQQILRDLSLLQVQMRDAEGFLESRRQLLTLKPNAKNNWISFAIANHLARDYATAIKAIDAYLNSMEIEFAGETREKTPMEAYEYSEIVLYKNMLLVESGDIAGALKHLDANRASIVDQLLFRELRSDLLFKLGRNEEAATQIEQLIEINPDNLDYHTQLLRAKSLLPADTLDKRAAIVAYYNQTRTPNDGAAALLPLQYLRPSESEQEHQLFCDKLSAYLQPKLRKGLPALFSSLKGIVYADSAKIKIVDTMISSYLENLRRSPSTFTGTGEEEPPSSLLYTLVFAAEHADQMGRLQTAISLLDEAIAHTPTLIDLYSLKARIFKHGGNPQAAADLWDQARQLDLADRYLNTKCAKYLLRAGRVDQAERTAVLFTKGEHNDTANVKTAVNNYLYDMQCLWWETELARCYARTAAASPHGEGIGRALRYFRNVERHFADFQEDQFDFHTYGLRKLTLRSYIALLRFEDELRGHDFYVRAARGLVEAHVRLHDNPAWVAAARPKTAEEQLEHGLAELPPEERKKELRKRQKELRRKQEAEAAASSAKAAAAAAGKPAKPHPAEGDDVDGTKLVVDVVSHLDEAVKVLKNLLTFAPRDAESQVLAAEVYLRKKRPLLVVRAVKQLAAVAPHHPAVISLKARLFQLLAAAPPTNPVVQKVLDAERPVLLENHESFAAYLEDYIGKARAEGGVAAAKFVAALEAMIIADPANGRARARSMLGEAENIVQQAGGGPKALAAAEALHRMVKASEGMGDEGAAEELRGRMLKQFPYAEYFGAPTDLARKRQESSMATAAGEGAKEEAPAAS